MLRGATERGCMRRINPERRYEERRGKEGQGGTAETTATRGRARTESKIKRITKSYQVENAG